MPLEEFPVDGLKSLGWFLTHTLHTAHTEAHFLTAMTHQRLNYIRKQTHVDSAITIWSPYFHTDTLMFFSQVNVCNLQKHQKTIWCLILGRVCVSVVCTGRWGAPVDQSGPWFHKTTSTWTFNPEGKSTTTDSWCAICIVVNFIVFYLKSILLFSSSF